MKRCPTQLQSAPYAGAIVDIAQDIRPHGPIRSGFHHSVNYRCVMAYGQARAVTDPTEKLRAANAFMDRFYPGRSSALRPPTELEMKAINILEMEIEEAVAKIRCTDVSDEEEDYAVPVWCAVLPLRTGTGRARGMPPPSPPRDT